MVSRSCADMLSKEVTLARIWSPYCRRGKLLSYRVIEKEGTAGNKNYIEKFCSITYWNEWSILGRDIYKFKSPLKWTFEFFVYRIRKGIPPWSCQRDFSQYLQDRKCHITTGTTQSITWLTLFFVLAIVISHSVDINCSISRSQ